MVEKENPPILLRVHGKVVILQHKTNLTMDGPNESEVLWNLVRFLFCHLDFIDAILYVFLWRSDSNGWFSGKIHVVDLLILKLII